MRVSFICCVHLEHDINLWGLIYLNIVFFCLKLARFIPGTSILLMSTIIFSAIGSSCLFVCNRINPFHLSNLFSVLYSTDIALGTTSPHHSTTPMSNHHQAYQRTPRGSRSGRSSVRHEDEAPGENLLIGGDKIPFVDSADEEEDTGKTFGGSAAAGSRGTIGNGDSSGNSSDSEDGDSDDVMTESQENLALAYVNRYRMPSLAERRNQDKLTVTIEHERKPTAEGRIM